MSERIETLGGIAARDRRIGARTDADSTVITAWLHHHGLGKARIIRPVCLECGGSGEVALDADSDEDVGPSITWKPCPACHGKPAPVSIVTAEAFKAWAQDSVRYQLEVVAEEPVDDAHVEGAAERLLAELGPFVVGDEVVEGTLTTKCGLRKGGAHRVVIVEHPQDDAGCKGWHEVGYLGDHVRIARLR